MRLRSTAAVPPTSVPIVPHFDPRPSPHDVAQVDQLAADLAREAPELALDERLRPLVLESWDEGPALHLDDFSGITRPTWAPTLDYMQDRARLRAGDGDFVVTAQAPVKGFEDYCRHRLGLGSPTWLVANHEEASLASACWQDRKLRRRLVAAIRREELAYLHPHMANGVVWELAARLGSAGGQPLRVIGPPPGVSQWANDKLAFAQTVKRLLGPSFVPRTTDACNLATLARRARDLGARTKYLAIKVPDSAGGGGNFVVESARLRGRSLSTVRRVLQGVLRDVRWDETAQLLVGCWETNVLAAPSAQLWLPPVKEGPPLVEGIFLQNIEGDAGAFAGMRPADFDDTLSDELARCCWLLGRLFQLLGYMGRCSFDMVLVGQSLARNRMKFIECNGRWGGTSLPMTLMNRLFGDWQDQPFAVEEFHHQGLRKVPFPAVLEQLGNLVYDTRTRTGEYVFFTPSRMQQAGTLSLIALADTWEAAAERAKSLPAQRLMPLVESFAKA